MTLGSRFVSSAALAGVLFVSSVARATPTFPAVVATHLGLSEAPDCSLCHAGSPGRGTVTTPFGASLRSRGAQAYDEAALRTALDALAAAKKDSDGDGAADTDELRAGADPNGGGESVVSGYGCRLASGAVERRAPSLGAGGLVAVALLALRRRGRARNSGPVTLRASRAKEQAI